MKICVINNLFEPFIKGGAEIIVDNIIRDLKIGGNEVFLITTKSYLQKKPKENDFEIHYINSLYFSLDKIPKIFRFFWHFFNLFSISSYFKIKSILKKEKPEIVMTHNLTGVGFLTPRAIQKRKIKHFHTIHDMQLLHPSGLMMYGKEKIFDSLYSKIYQKITSFIFRKVGKVISPSEWLLREHLGRNFFKNADKIVAPNPIKLNLTESHLKKNYQEVNILYVGQIGGYKGLNLLVEIFSDLKFSNTKLTIIGSGKEENKLINQLSNLNNIKFLGRKSNEEVKKTMQSSSFLVVPSLCYENSPTVIYEAASLGLPVIASRIGGIPELIHHFGGILFNPGDKTDLEKKIDWATKNPLELEKIGEKSKREISRLMANEYIESILKN